MTTSPNGGKQRAPHRTPMALDRLRALLDAYGAAPAHWPHAERAAAEALIDSSADARALVAQAAQLDALLDLVHPPAPTAALAERLQRRRFGWRGLRAVGWGEGLGSRMRRWMTSPKHQVAAVAGALLFGLLLGAGISTDDQSAVANAGPAPARVAAVGSDGGQLLVESATAQPTGPGAIAAVYDRNFSSNGDPAFDAPDPFGAAAHGMDLVEGARLTGVPVPASGEPLGSIPLL